MKPYNMASHKIQTTFLKYSSTFRWQKVTDNDSHTNVHYIFMKIDTRAWFIAGPQTLQAKAFILRYRQFFPVWNIRHIVINVQQKHTRQAKRIIVLILNSYKIYTNKYSQKPFFYWEAILSPYTIIVRNFCVIV